MEKKHDKTLHDLIKEAIDSDEDFFSDFEGMGPPDEEVPDDFRALITSVYQPKKKPHKFLKVSVLILAFFCCSSMMAVFISEHNTVDAIKFRLEQFVWSINGNLVTVGEAEDGSGQTEMTMEITDWKDIGQAKKFLKELYVPTYIPKEYEFQLLKIAKSLKLPYYVEYLYLNQQDQTLIIYQEYSLDANPSILSLEEIYKMQESILGTVYFTYNATFDLCYGMVLNGNDLIDVGGDVSEEELLKIIEGLEE